MRIVVTGNRDWTDVELVRAVIRGVHNRNNIDVLVHGACRGLDTIAADCARELGITVEAHPADWKTFGRPAGPIQNEEMVRTHPDLCLAFHDNLEHSCGTRDMVKRCKRVGVPVILTSSDGQMTEP